MAAANDTQVNPGTGSHLFAGMFSHSELPGEFRGCYVPDLSGYMLGWGATKPADNDSGWAPGALFIVTSGTPDLYQNVGTAALANFDAV